MSNSISYTTPLCDVQYAESFIGAHRWNDNWMSASSAEKLAVLVNSTNVILRFVKFYNDDGDEISYEPTGALTIPEWLKQSCCYEALYFLDLDNDPARPFPLGILGLIKSGTETFDHDYEPPLFSAMAKGLLEQNGCDVHDPNGNNTGWGNRIRL